MTIPSGTTVTWPAPGVQPGSIIKTITVDGTLIVPKDQVISFSASGKIELNGKMELYGVLTTQFNDWIGIRMKYSSLLTPPTAPYGGFFYGDGGRIEKARIAIMGSDQNDIGPIPYNYGVGKIVCKNMVFRNNGTCIWMYNYKIFATPIVDQNGNYSYLEPTDIDIMTLDNCVFEFTKSYTPPAYSFVNLSGVQGYPPEFSVRFNNCTFRNYSSSTTVIGINAKGSKFLVNNSTFVRLAKGIDASRKAYRIPFIGGLGYINSPYTVTGSRFYHCNFGIINNTVSAFAIDKNFFWMGKKKPNGFTKMVGVYTEGHTSGFSMQNNRFYGFGTSNNAVPSYGTYCKDIGASNMNVVNGNLFVRLTYGNVAEDKNGDVHGGLSYVCNKVVGDHGIDFSALSEDDLALRLDQGVPGPYFDWRPSMNKFSWDKIDFYANNVENYRYYVPTTISAPSLKRVIPKKYSGIELKYAEGDNICEDYFYYKSKFKEYARLTDVEKQGYRQEYFSNLRAFETKQKVNKTTSSVNEKKATSQEMTFHRLKMEESTFMMYNNAIATSAPRDTILRWLHRFKSPAGDYMLAENYISTQDFEAAKEVLDMMPQKYDFSAANMDDYQRMVDIYEGLMEGSGNRLSEPMIQMLEEYADEPRGQARYKARNLLAQEEGYFFIPDLAEIPLLNNEEKSNDKLILTKMVVFPNPVDYNTTFDWGNFDFVGKDVSIEITSQTGGLIQVVHPSKGSYYTEWTTEGISGNLLYYRLLFDGVEVDAGQIILNK